MANHPPHPSLGWLGVNTLWTMDLEGGIPEPVFAANLRFRELTQADAEDLGRAMGPGAAVIVRQRFGTGCRCFAGELNGAIATYGWVSFEYELIGELELGLHLRTGEAYIWDCLTIARYRGRGYYPWLLGQIVRVLRSEGVRRVWIGAKRWNRASARGIEKVGFARVATVVCVRFLRRNWRWILPASCVPPSLVKLACAALDGSGKSGS